ncbi:MAG: ATP-binding protein, partial [Ghiorsea sp.]
VPIQISIYPDKLMIWNPGELPPNWTVDKLKGKHASQPFNPDVANVFFRAGLIESWGRGIERIMQACAKAGVPTPEISSDVNGLWITFHFLSEHQVESTTQSELGEATVETTVKTPERIIDVLRKNPELSLDEVARHIGKSLRAVERATAKMVKEGRLQFVGPKKGGHWQVLK